jgi:hypothetical protein
LAVSAIAFNILTCMFTACFVASTLASRLHSTISLI